MKLNIIIDTDKVYCAKPTKYEDIERYHLIKVDTRVDKIGD